MTRQEILADYKVDSHGVIRTLGKFEAEMLYVPHFWEALMDGGADDDCNGVVFFVVATEDRQEFPELGKTFGIALMESDQGFVSASHFDTESEYLQAIREEEEAQESADCDY